MNYNKGLVIFFFLLLTLLVCFYLNICKAAVTCNAPFKTLNQIALSSYYYTVSNIQ